MKLENTRQGPAAMRRPWRLTTSIGDTVFGGFVTGAALSLLVLIAVILYELIDRSNKSITELGFGFLTSTTWDTVHGKFGAAPAIYGTLFSSAIGLVLAVPIGIGAAIYLSEMAPSWIRTPVSFLVEMLAAIPSVVYGLWALFVMVPWIRTAVEPTLGDHLSFIPLFDGPPFGIGFLAAGFVLAIMILPIITAISRDAILAVPTAQREAMYALGGTKWEVVSRAVLPYCRSGLVGAAMLALGRALGETIAVTMVIGKGYFITGSLFEPGATAASQLASEFPEAGGALHKASLIELALILMVITLLVNVLARLLVWRFARAPSLIRE